MAGRQRAAIAVRGPTADAAGIDHANPATVLQQRQRRGQTSHASPNDQAVGIAYSLLHRSRNPLFKSKYFTQINGPRKIVQRVMT